MSLTAIVRRTLALLLAYLSAQAHAQAELLTYKEVLERPGRPEPDQRFAYGPEAGQSAELWLPRGHAGGPLPVAVLVHGGCWVSDYPGAELVAWLADALRAQGVAVWSITYRRVGLERNTMGGGYPATFLDAGAALDYLRVVAPGHGLDLSRVVTTGHSAGGHLALWLAARPRLPADSPLRVAAPLPVKAVVSLAGLPELPYAAEVAAHACGAGTVAKLVDLEHRGEAAWRDTSVPEMLPLGVPQTLISGVYDGTAPPVHAWRYRALAAAKGEAVALRNLDDAGHFELIAPWTPAGREVVAAIVAALR
jgi:acetyl esterase/lipase